MLLSSTDILKSARTQVKFRLDIETNQDLLQLQFERKDQQDSDNTQSQMNTSVIYISLNFNT